MSYTIKQDFINFNNPDIDLNAIGTVLHSTATPGATDEDEQSYFDKKYRGASAHAFIDWDSITQTIDFKKRAWHAGPTANKNFIGVELCEPKGFDPDKFLEVWRRSTWFFAYIHYKILGQTTITKAILRSHAEISKQYPTETNHTDPEAYFKKYNKTVDQFRQAVQAEINAMIKSKTSPLTINKRVEEFQECYNKIFKPDIKVNGLFDSETSAALDKFPQLSSHNCYFLAAVRLIQKWLKIKTDGLFGPLTHKAVIEFQEKNGLKKDGIVGPKTYKKLMGV